MALATIEEITQDALVLTGDSIDSTESGTTLVGYVVRESLDPAVWLPWASQSTILEASYPALTNGKTYPGEMTASNGISFIMTTEGSGNRDLAELTYDYLYVDQLMAQNIPTAWTNEGLLRARITFDLGFQGTVAVSMAGMFRGNWFQGFTPEDGINAGKVGRFTASFFMEDFLDADWPTTILDPATATKADIRAFINQYKSDIANFTIDWISDASFMTSPATELDVNVDARFFEGVEFNQEVCLPNLDVTAGTSLALDSNNCIIAVAAGMVPDDEFVNDISGTLDANYMVDLTLGYEVGNDVNLADAIDLSKLKDTLIEIDGDASPTDVSVVTFDSGHFTLESDVVTLHSSITNDLTVGTVNQATDPDTYSNEVNNVQKVYFDDRHFTLQGTGTSGEVEVIGTSTGSGIDVQNNGTSVSNPNATMNFSSGISALPAGSGGAAAEPLVNVSLDADVPRTSRFTVTTAGVAIYGESVDMANGDYNSTSGAWTINHTIGHDLLNIQVYADGPNLNEKVIIIPDEITTLNTTTFRIDFGQTGVEGYVVVTG